MSWTSVPSFIPFFLLSFLLMPCYMFSNSSCCHYSSSLCFCYVFPFSYHSLTVTSVTVFLSRGREASALLRLPMYAAAAIKSLQSCLTLCDPIDGSPPGSPIPGILQARTLEWVAISFSDAWKWKVKVKSLSHVWLFTTPWTAACQAPLSMGVSRQEYWSGLPLPSLSLSW